MRRRIYLGGSVALALGLATAVPAVVATPAHAAGPVPLTILATTDIHGHVDNWDYYSNAAYTKPADQLGMVKVGSIVKDVKAAKPADSVVVLDNGDYIQGTPLTAYYGSPAGAGTAAILDGTAEHPMAKALKAVGYDAQVVGNHEFNYGLDLLSAYEGDTGTPLLGANVLKAGTTDPYLTPYTMIDRTISGTPVKIGVIGVVTPGVRVWDKQNVEGKLEFQDMVAAVKQWVPVVRAAGAEVVVVLAHTGEGNTDLANYDYSALYENAAEAIAQLTAGVDVIIDGHTHLDVPQHVFSNADGEPVIVSQPNYWARSVSQIDLTLIDNGAGGLKVDKTGWTVGSTSGLVTPHYGKDYADDADVANAVATEHQTVVDYVNSPVFTSVAALSAANAPIEDTPIIDFVNYVQTEAVHDALVKNDSAYKDLPILSIAAPFSRTAAFPKGNVTVRDVAGLYIYENTLMAVTMTGSQIKDFLEYSAYYYKQIGQGDAITLDITNNQPPGATRGIPDYNLDQLSGVEYVIDVSKPLGERIVSLMYNGVPVTPGQQFVVAVNNYRASGGGGFPHIASAPVVYDEAVAIRELLIDWASAKGTLDPAEFAQVNWRLTSTPYSQALYRFYKNDGTHFYTASDYEASLVKGYPQYSYEGIAGYINPASDTVAPGQAYLYRFYKNDGTHFYTSSEYEANLVKTYRQYSYEGIAGVIDTAKQPGNMPAFRYYKTAAGTHFFTAVKYEANLVDTYPQYKPEGIGFYLWPAMW